MNGAGDAHVVPGTWCLVDYFRSLAAIRQEIAQLVPREGKAACLKLEDVPKSAADALKVEGDKKDSETKTADEDDSLPFVRILSHFHGDHYSGLSDQWNAGIVHCTEITADLLVRVMGVDARLVKSHPFDEEIDFTGFSVTFLDANHAPGAAMLLVRRHADGELFLHCGDMRYAARMQDYPALQRVRGKLDTIFLDSTYANPKHVFPTQQESIAKAAAEAKAFVEADPDANTLVMVSAYTIGKERIVFGIAEAIGAKSIFASERKRTVMGCLRLPTERAALFTDDRTAQVHMCRMGAAGDVWPYFQPNFTAVQTYIDKIRAETGFRFDRVIAFIPTGWAESSNWNKLNRSRVNEEGNFMVNLIPYSEHSNFPELMEFVGFLKPRSICPTVFSSPEHRRKIVHLFRHKIDHGKAKRKFLAAFTKTKSEPSLDDAAVASADSKPSEIRQDSEAVSNLKDETGGIDDEDDVIVVEGSSTASSQGPWSCSACTFRNKDPSALDCAMCGTKRQLPAKIPANAPVQPSPPRKRAKNPPPATKKAKGAKTSKTLFSFNFAGGKSNNSAANPDTADAKPEILDVTPNSPDGKARAKDAKPSRPGVKAGTLIGTLTPPDVKVESSKAKSRSPSVTQSKTDDASSLEGTPRKSQEPKSADVLASMPDLAEDAKSFDPAGVPQGDIPFAILIEALRLTSGTTKRLKKHNVLVNAFRCGLHATRDPDNLVKLLSLSMGRIANEYEGIELSVGGSIVSDAVRRATGTTAAEMRKLYKETGDLGDVAFLCKTSQRTLFGLKPQPLSVSTVFDTLRKISKEAGSGSKKRRTDWVLKLLRQCVGEETRYLVRMLIRNLRIGASEASILDAFAEAALRDRAETVSAEALSRARTAFNCAPDMARFVGGLLQDGIVGLEEACVMTPGIPVRPMLANVCHGVEEFMDSFEGRGAFTLEYKYDGQRIQIHASPDGSLRLYSRHCRDCTSGFPEVAGIMRDAQKQSGARSFILDAEVVAVDRTSAEPKILPFQTLSTRARKNDDGVEVDAKVSVCIFAFDLIALDGNPLLQQTLRERRTLLSDAFHVLPGRFGLVDSQDFEPVDAANREREVEAMTALMQKALHASCEGLMAKLLDDAGATYQPNYRSSVWLKLKQDYISDQSVSEQLEGGGLADTLDLVPIGAWHGNGRKAKWWSPFLLACWDPEEEVFRAVCKVMSGFTDAFYESQNAFYANNVVEDALEDENDAPEAGERTLAQKPFDYDVEHRPSAWFRACQVWEIRGAELTLSENATAARGLVPDGHGDVHPRGLSVRFPRFIRVREDKRPEDATTPGQLVDMFLKQTRR